MPSKVKAQEGDSLCKLAVDAGFANCDPLRAESANSGFLNRPLRPGDEVTIPDIQVQQQENRGVEAQHVFERQGVPVPSIRFVHGSPDKAPADDDTLTILNVSNYVTTRAGVPETQPFPNHSTSAFNAAANADVDAFKVEIHDAHAAASTIDVELLALKPTYNGAGAVTGHEEFTGGDRGDRALTVTCRKTKGDPHRFRSCYLRLVTDAEDKAARPRQTLLATDMADGANADNDRVEILDQRVRVQLPISICRVGGASRCVSVRELPIGEDRLRMRLKILVLRQAPGGAALVSGITLQEVRRHVMKWVRRTYAAVNMGVRLVGTQIDAIDPMENLISIFNVGRQLTRGGTELRVSLNTAPAVTRVTYTPATGETPHDVANGLAGQINAVPGFSAVVSDNPLSFNNALSSDILVTRTDGARVVLSDERSTDARTRIGIGRVNAGFSTTPEGNYGNVGARDHRTLIRNFATDPAAIHVFVIRRFRATDGAVGFAYGRDVPQAAQFQGTPPVRGCCFIDSGTMRNTDRQVHTTDHEIGHILIDMIHFSGRHPELMTDEPVDARNSVGASKRMTDRVLPYRQFLVGRGTVSLPLNPCNEARTRENAAFLEAWPR